MSMKQMLVLKKIKKKKSPTFSWTTMKTIFMCKPNTKLPPREF